MKEAKKETCMVTKLVVASTNGAANRSVVSLFLIWDNSMDRSKV